MSSFVDRKVQRQFCQYPKRSYARGQILVFAGETPQHIFYLRSGRVREYDISAVGDEVIVNIFKPPAFFAMSWAINRQTNKYFYKTETPVELHTVPIEEALDFLKSNPDVMLDLLSRVYKGLEGVLSRSVHLMGGTAKSRLIYELIVECRRFGEQQQTGSYILKNTREGDFAARTGLARETVSREMHKLQEEGWAHFTKEGILIPDPYTLEIAIDQWSESGRADH